MRTAAGQLDRNVDPSQAEPQCGNSKDDREQGRRDECSPPRLSLALLRVRRLGCASLRGRGESPVRAWREHARGGWMSLCPELVVPSAPFEPDREIVSACEDAITPDEARGLLRDGAVVTDKAHRSRNNPGSECRRQHENDEDSHGRPPNVERRRAFSQDVQPNKGYPRDLARAGMPATISSGGTSRVTTAADPAPVQVREGPDGDALTEVHIGNQPEMGLVCGLTRQSGAEGTGVPLPAGEGRRTPTEAGRSRRKEGVRSP
jgi:hypothetical protein